MPMPSELVLQAARQLLRPAERCRLDRLVIDDAGHGYDAFGLHASWLALGMLVTGGLYRRWFRVESHGIEHVPKAGPAVLAANHGGMLPIDAMMVWADLVRRTEPPRVPRPVVDNFVPLLPFVSTFFTRVGAVGGSRGNVHRLLERGELVLIFPEGTTGVGKPRAQRFRLQAWRVGHAEMAIRHRAPVVPVAILGPDEQFPLVWRAPLHAFGAPYVPISLLPFPLPVHYAIHYGEPLLLHEGTQPDDADDPEVSRRAAERVRAAEQALIDRARGSYRKWA